MRNDRVDLNSFDVGAGGMADREGPKQTGESVVAVV